MRSSLYRVMTKTWSIYLANNVLLMKIRSLYEIWMPQHPIHCNKPRKLLPVLVSGDKSVRQENYLKVWNVQYIPKIYRLRENIAYTLGTCAPSRSSDNLYREYAVSADHRADCVRSIISTEVDAPHKKSYTFLRLVAWSVCPL